MRIAIWPNGDWCETHLIDSYTRDMGLSDDYAVFFAFDEEHAEAIASRVQRTGC